MSPEPHSQHDPVGERISDSDHGHEPALQVVARLLDGAGAAHMHAMTSHLGCPGPVVHGRDDLGNILVVARPDPGSDWDAPEGVAVHLSVIELAPYAWVKVRLADVLVQGRLRLAPPIMRCLLPSRTSESPHLAPLLEEWRGAHLYVLEPTAIRVRTPLCGQAYVGPDDARLAEADPTAREQSSAVPMLLHRHEHLMLPLVEAHARRTAGGCPRGSRFDAAYPIGIDGWGMTTLAMSGNDGYLVRIPFMSRVHHVGDALEQIRSLADVT